nr:hypothetical protein CFP56_22539 [Quercus suber]
MYPAHRRIEMLKVTTPCYVKVPSLLTAYFAFLGKSARRSFLNNLRKLCVEDRLTSNSCYNSRDAHTALHAHRYEDQLDGTFLPSTKPNGFMQDTESGSSLCQSLHRRHPVTMRI